MGSRGETHIQVLQTVPAEGVFAALTQHLRTALVPLDVDTAHGTLLDRQVGVTVGAGPEGNTGEVSGMEHSAACCMKPCRPHQSPGGV